MPTVLIVDDLATARMALRLALESDPDIDVVGEASCGSEALRLIERRQPDLVTMDLFLRRENGLDVAASIMAKTPRPILIVTSADTSDTELIFRAVQVGALEVAAKLPSTKHPAYEQQRLLLVRLIKSLARVPVVHRFHPARKLSTEPSPVRARERLPARETPTAGYQVVLIGSSTGGPPALNKLLGALQTPFPLPIVIVQHMADGFMSGFIDWLHQVTGHRIVIADQSTRLEAGTVYVPPDDHHLRLSSPHSVVTSTEPPRGHQRPAVDILFESAADQLGSGSIGVILTGMGSDGSEGMLALHQAGALTMAQEPESCVVGSMPEQAIALGGVSKVLQLEALGPEIRRTVAAADWKR